MGYRVCSDELSRRVADALQRRFNGTFRIVKIQGIGTHRPVRMYRGASHYKA